MSPEPNRTPEETRGFLSFLWSGQSGYFELARFPNQRRLYDSVAEALADIAGKRFFAPLARTRRGSTGEDVSVHGNVLWVDMDTLTAEALIDARLRPLGLDPSAVIYSGNKGYWAFFKLKEAIPTDDVERLNKSLARLLDADTCWDRPRIARLPGSVHPDSGNTARVVEQSERVHEWERVSIALEAACPSAAPGPPATRSRSLSQDSVEGRFTAFGERAPLSRELWDYIKRRPARGQGCDRSAVEQQIFATLVVAGWTDEQIVAFADACRLPRHTEERAKRSNWTERSINKARTYIGDTSPMCMEHEPSRPYLNRVTLLKLIDGQTVGELERYVFEEFGASRATTTRALTQLESKDLIRRSRRGRHTHVIRTEKAEFALSTRFRSTLFLPTVAALKNGGYAVRAWSSEASTDRRAANHDIDCEPTACVPLPYESDTSDPNAQGGRIAQTTEAATVLP
jgi:hypothetical protein